MFEFEEVENSLENLCKDCGYYNTDECVKSKCYVGFAERMIKYSKENSVPAIENGISLIPIDDMKNYREDLIAEAIAQVCKVCHECRENHSEQCIVSIVRRSLENAIFKENTPYNGSVLMYLMDLSKQNPRIVEMIKESYVAK